MFKLWTIQDIVLQHECSPLRWIKMSGAKGVDLYNKQQQILVHSVSINGALSVSVCVEAENLDLFLISVPLLQDSTLTTITISEEKLFPLYTEHTGRQFFLQVHRSIWSVFFLASCGNDKLLALMLPIDNVRQHSLIFQDP